MERLTKRIIFGREVPTAALCNAPSEVCEGAKSCGSCDFLRDKIFQRLAAYEDTNHTPEECAAAFEELAAYRAAEQELAIEDIAYAYLQLCEKDCAGDCTTGIPPCRFYNPPDVGLFGEPLPFGCELEDYCEYRSEVALKEQEAK